MKILGDKKNIDNKYKYLSYKYDSNKNDVEK